MKAEKLPSGSYRVRKTIDKKVYQKTFEKKPTKKEIDAWVADIMSSSDPQVKKGTFEQYANSYLDAKSNVLSQTTIRGYGTIIRTLSEHFLGLELGRITMEDIQIEINELAASKSAKTVKNINGFISAVIGMYRPSFNVRTTLPRSIPPTTYVPTDEDLAKVLAFARGKSYELPILLGAHGMRESECLAVTDKDLHLVDGQYMLDIHRAKVNGTDGFVTQDFMKTDNSYRTIPIDKYTAELLLDQKTGYASYPTTLWHNLSYAEEKSGVPHFKFHALRHYFVSKAHSLGVPDAVIRYICGFSNNYVMDRHYKHPMADQIANSTTLVLSDVMGIFKTLS